MEDGQKVVFSGEGDQEPGLEPGDIIIVLDEKEHEVFRRVGTDLTMKMHISLVEAICGFQRPIKTLEENRSIVITTIPGEVIRNNEVKCVLGEGMPQYKNPFEKGRLLIQFVVDFPPQIAPDRVSKLEKILPARPEVMIPDDCEECQLADIDPSQRNRRFNHSIYDDDDDDHGPR